jgi:hypothetical protein
VDGTAHDRDVPPRRTRGPLWRALLGGVLITSCTAGALSAAVLELGKMMRVLPHGIPVPEVSRPEAGEAQTIMVLGSDVRYEDRRGLRRSRTRGPRARTRPSPAHATSASRSCSHPADARRGHPGRRLLVYRDGSRIRLVALRTSRGVFRMANTLTRSLPDAEMLGIAASLRALDG